MDKVIILELNNSNFLLTLYIFINKKNMKRIIRLNEGDLIKLIKRVIREGVEGTTPKEYKFPGCTINANEEITKDGSSIRVNCNNKQNQVLHNCTQSGFYSGKLFIVEKDASPTEYTQTIKSQTDLLPLMHSFCKNV